MEAGRDIKIKVCGMRDAENITKVAELRPDYMGFIFYPPSPRYVGDNFRLLDNIDPHVVRVGVFVNAGYDEIIQRSALIGFNHVQLHGNESAEDAARLRDSGFKIVKVFSVDDAFDFSITKEYIAAVDYFLFDTKGKLHGGNARTFNWNVLQRYDQELPFFLSGGLSSENIAEITTLNGMNLHAVDVNSGVEDTPGMKSLSKLGAVFDRMNTLDVKRIAK